MFHALSVVTKIKPKALKELAKTGKTAITEAEMRDIDNASIKKVFKMVDRGEISFKAIDKAITKLTTGNGIFAEVKIKYYKEV